MSSIVTRTIAIAAGEGWGRTTFYHREARNADGTAVRCRSNGKCKVWKTRPEDFRLPVKYGLRDCFYITPRNQEEWLTTDPTAVEEPTPTIPTAKWRGLKNGVPVVNGAPSAQDAARTIEERIDHPGTLYWDWNDDLTVATTSHGGNQYEIRRTTKKVTIHIDARMKDAIPTLIPNHPDCDPAREAEKDARDCEEYEERVDLAAEARGDYAEADVREAGR